MSEERPRLQLLDLPTDVLTVIVKNVSHTNDLAALALTHSALHALAITHIYSRFDIVWPDSTTISDSRGGVDALTHGLATLNMAEDVFGETPWQRERARIQAGGAPASDRQIRVRRGNYYASYIHKFSIGNGPRDWVEEYFTNKEAGKMLGTLVALALARMKSLESFVWDMPTGILRDIWQSLSYLGDRADGQPCKLEQVSVRWHRNRHMHPSMFGEGPIVDQTKALQRVEHPSFSILPPLKSLGVFDIDEMQYLDEMSVLIGRSLDKLRQLRIGIAASCKRETWTQAWNEDNFDQIDLSNPVRSTATLGGHRRGGVLGVLTSAFLDLKQQEAISVSNRTLRRRSRALPLFVTPEERRASQATDDQLRLAHSEMTAGETAGDSSFGDDTPATHVSGADAAKNHPQNTSVLEEEDGSLVEEYDEAEYLSPTRTNSHPNFGDEIPRRLRLETLEMDHVCLSLPVLRLAIDWSMLTSLTILNCPHHGDVWAWLYSSYSQDLKGSAFNDTARSPKRRRSTVGDYGMARLRLRHIHVNDVLPIFVRFVNECLAPNTLQSLFLQQNDGLAPLVSVDDIFNGIVKRHKGSLQRLLIDSSKRKKNGNQARTPSWKHWAVTTDRLNFITGGKMLRLRELGICIAHQDDWHHFVRRLPGLPELRTLYVPRSGSMVGRPSRSSKEAAMHILDAVTFNPGMKLCYVGIGNVCFEIMEGDEEPDEPPTAAASSSHVGTGRLSDDEDEEDDDDFEDEDGDDDEDGDGDEEDEVESDGEDRPAATWNDPQQKTPAFEYLDSDSEDDTADTQTAKFHLREILFYDDKVQIFRRRHGRL